MAACLGALVVREAALCVNPGHFFAVTLDRWASYEKPTTTNQHDTVILYRPLYTVIENRPGAAKRSNANTRKNTNPQLPTATRDQRTLNSLSNTTRFLNTEYTQVHKYHM